MRPIHKNSSIAVLPNMDLFGVPTTQVSIENTTETEFRPLSAPKPGIPIEFQFTPGIDQYIAWSETYLLIKMKIILTKSDGTSASSTEYDDLLPVNNFMHSLFESIELKIGNKVITYSPHSYMYRAYIENLLSSSQESRDGHLGVSGWDDSTTNRKAWFKDGKEMEFMGRLHIDLANQCRSLVGGLPISLTLKQNDPAFYLNYSGSFKAEPIFTAASLHVVSHKVSNFLLEAHRKAASIAPFKYPINRVEIRHITVAAQSNDAVIDNLIIGQMPRRMFVCFVKNSAFTGSLAEDPYEFKPNNVTYIAAFINGTQYPTNAYTPDFTKGLFTRPYLDLFRVTDQNVTDSNFKLTKNSYKTNKCIFPFNFSPDLSNGCDSGGHVSPIQSGSLRLYIKFAGPLDHALDVLFYCQYDNLIEVDSDNIVQTDYN